MLKEEGKLLFSDSLGKFFPKIPFKEITIKQLLNHTSGIPDYYTFMEKYWDKSKVANNNDILTILEKEQIELDFEPGQKYKYSNTGYVLLALIIENVTGEIYSDFMKSKIFDPSEMKNTFVKHSELNIFNENEIAKGYICSISNGYVLPEYFEDYNYLKYLDGTIGDGNIFSTVDDLLKFDNALNSGKIISNQSLSEMFTSGILSNNDTIEIELKGQSYGYGWRIRNSQIGKIVWHSGHLPGISNLYVKNLENNITIFILSNNGFETYKIYDTILEIITNTQMEEPKIFGEIALKKFLHDNKISEKL
jgi:CubicO group peptidase (beta-lactamase class C family)